MEDPAVAARALAEELSLALKTLHRALVLSEAGDDPALQNPYTLLFSVIHDPRFAWTSGLSQLIVQLDEMQGTGEISALGDLLPFRDAVASLLGDGDDQDPRFRLRYLTALQKSPDVALATGRLRSAMKALPQRAS